MLNDILCISCLQRLIYFSYEGPWFDIFFLYALWNISQFLTSFLCDSWYLLFLAVSMFSLIPVDEIHT